MMRWYLFAVTAVLVLASAETGHAQNPRADTAPPRKSHAAFPAAWHVPETVTIPPGRFVMGAPAAEGGDDSERPMHEVRIARAFAMGKYLVTFEQWDACLADGGCGGYRPSDLGLGRGRMPVFAVNWNDARGYAAWLSARTGQRWRLPTEAEWEYAARAGTTTAYWWGSSVGRNHANCNGCRGAFDGVQGPTPVGRFPPNRFGLYDMIGNLFEWTADCWDDTYVGAPADGSSWNWPDCGGRVARGGSYDEAPENVRAGFRAGLATEEQGDATGFRVARTLTPDP